MDNQLRLLTILSVLGTLIVLAIVGIDKGFRNKAIFFNSALDLGISLVLFLGGLIVVFVLKATTLIILLRIVIIWHAIQAAIFNWGKPFDVLCIWLGRCIVGVFIPLGIFFDSKNSTNGSELSSSIESIKSSLWIFGAFWVAIKLINGDKVRENMVQEREQ